MNAGIAIREATQADAAALGAMHAASWAETYPGLVPDDLLAAMSDPDRRQAMWAGILAQPPLPGGVLVAVQGGDVVAYISVGAARDRGIGTGGEVTGLYALRSVQGRGLGRALLGRAAAVLLDAGHADAGAWALDTNLPAQRFYAATGAIRGPSRVDRRGRHELHETAWIWHDLSLLRQR